MTKKGISDMNRLIICLTACALLAARPSAQTLLWQEFITLRDAMYNRVYPSGAIKPLYDSAVSAAKKTFAGNELLVALSKCEYMFGRNYLYDEQKDEAGVHFDLGADYAKRAADASGSSEAWLMYAENVSQNCTVKPVSYAISNGSKLAGIASRVIKQDPANAAAHILLYSQDVYAPAPFHNHKRGIKNMTALLNDGTLRVQKDDKFNILCAIAYAHFQEKNYAEAASWFSQTLAVYPGNEFAKKMLAESRAKL
jgi:tetratricopeptide (TPR) repeat protein